MRVLWFVCVVLVLAQMKTTQGLSKFSGAVLGLKSGLNGLGNGIGGLGKLSALTSGINSIAPKIGAAKINNIAPGIGGISSIGSGINGISSIAPRIGGINPGFGSLASGLSSTAPIAPTIGNIATIGGIAQNIAGYGAGFNGIVNGGGVLNGCNLGFPGLSNIPNPLEVVSGGGSFPVTSASPIAPTGVQVVSENCIEGSLGVEGTLPLLGSVNLEGAFPTLGAGAVSYDCGNGAIGIGTEGPIRTGIVHNSPVKQCGSIVRQYGFY